MNRRTVLAGAAGVLGVSAAGAVTTRKLFPARHNLRGEYAEDDEVAYDHDDLRFRASQAAVHRGETIEFEVTNTTDSRVPVGCNVPWAIERHADDTWYTVTWTGREYYQMCASALPSGESYVERVTLSTDALDRQTGDVEVRGELQPGRYRFVLLGPSPFLAVDFEVLPARE